MTMSSQEPESAEQHTDEAIELLRLDEGVWDAHGEVWPEPQAQPVALTGVATNRLVGGRWLVSDWVTDTGFIGHGVYGWDSDQEMFVATWVDNMQSALALGKGSFDAQTATMAYDFQTTSQGQLVRYRETYQRMKDGTRLYRNLVPLPDGTEFEVIRVTYRRRAAPVDQAS
jgi:hypothetical protein